MSEHDLKVFGGDLVFGADDEPEFYLGHEVIAQDIRHRLRASGRVADLVADDTDPQASLAEIAFEVEADDRIKPGTASTLIEPDDSVRIEARTTDGGEIFESIIL